MLNPIPPVPSHRVCPDKNLAEFKLTLDLLD